MRPPTAHRFAAWLASTGLRRVRIAQLLGVHPSYITHLASGRYTPGLELAAAIERESAGWTKGPIRAAEWTRRRVAAAPEAA